MVDYNNFCKNFLRSLNACNVPVMPLPGVVADSRLDVDCDYNNSILFCIADAYQEPIGFSSLIAYKGIDGYLKAVVLTQVTEKCIRISQGLGMIYGAPYKRTLRGDNDIIYFI